MHTKKVEVGVKRKQFKVEEIVVLCKVYCIATHNSIKGLDKRIDVFIATLLEVFERVAPIHKEEYIYDDYGGNARYLCDNIFKDIQKITKTRQMVEYSNPSEVANQ